MSEPALEFTGERFTPECVREIWYEHWHRYAFAQPLAAGRRVLDAASGEGYGSALLATQAADVLGVDLSPEAVAHARARYAGRANLRFETGDATRLDALPNAAFDLIVSFETLEHVAAQEHMLDGFARLLAPGGLLLVSTPDRHNYSDVPGFRNEHHVRELYRDEFEALLAARFPQRRLYAHKLLFQSALWALDGDGPCRAATMQPDGTLAAGFDYPPLYYVAACARDADALAALPAVSLFGDAAESVYAHYDAEIRKNIGAGHRILELERELDHERRERAELQRRLDAARG
jgi:SAM-dependent methyltransferase